MTIDGLTLIAKRRSLIEQERQKLQHELARLDAERERLTQEENDLKTAERVLQSLANGADSARAVDEVLTGLVETAALAKTSIPRVGKPRPQGIPTVRAMIEQLLMEAEREGKDGLRGRDIVVQISHRWWPGVGWNSILPTAIRLVKDKHLGRSDDLFVRVDEKGHLRSKMPLRGAG